MVEFLILSEFYCRSSFGATLWRRPSLSLSHGATTTKGFSMMAVFRLKRKSLSLKIAQFPAEQLVESCRQSLALHDKLNTASFSLSSFFFFNPCTGWLWLSQGRRSDEEEHEPFVQTPSAERVKRKEKKTEKRIADRWQRGGTAGPCSSSLHLSSSEKQLCRELHQAQHFKALFAFSLRRCTRTGRGRCRRRGRSNQRGDAGIQDRNQRSSSGAAVWHSIFGPPALSWNHHNIKALTGGPRKKIIEESLYYELVWQWTYIRMFAVEKKKEQAVFEIPIKSAFLLRSDLKKGQIHIIPHLWIFPHLHLHFKMKARGLVNNLDTLVLDKVAP